MSIDTVVDLGIGQNTTGATVSVIIPTGVNVPAGSFIIVGVAEDGPTSVIGTVADSKLVNSYVRKVGAVNAGNSTFGTGSVFIVWNCSPLVAGDSIIYTKSITNHATAISAFYATGVMKSGDPTNLISAPVVGVGNTSITGTPSAGDLAVVFVATNPRANADSFTINTPIWTPPFSVAVVASGAEGLAGAHLISDGSTVTYSQTESNSGARHTTAWMLSFMAETVPLFAFGGHPFPV